MPSSYPTLPLGAKPVKNRGNYWLAIEVKDVDLWLWHLKTNGTEDGQMTGILVRPDASQPAI
jgi:hypothetical protein